MATVRDFEGLKVWQAARRLNARVAVLLRNDAMARDFAFRDQVHRSSVSIMANIAEGFERGGNREFIQFLSVAKGSAGELRAHLYAALDSGYIDESAFNEARSDLVEISRMLGALMEYLRSSGVKGIKFKTPGTSGDEIRESLEDDSWIVG